jgi:hypothetical protein
MELSRDSSDLFRALSSASVEYLVVGAHALGGHDRPRTTKHLDTWIRVTAENAQRTWNALAAFGAPMDRLRLDDLIDEDTIFQIGEESRCDVFRSILAAVVGSNAMGKRSGAPDLRRYD